MTEPTVAASIRGVNHLALVCSDMARTVDFYSNVLGFPLVKTVELPAGWGQHFFFDIGGGATLAFFWFPDAPDGVPGITHPSRKPPPDGTVSAVSSMNHVAFDVAPEEIEGERLVDRPVHRRGRRARREPELCGVAERPDKRQVPMDDVVLGHVADVRPVVGSCDAHLARRRRPDADHGLEQRRLPRPAAADDRDDLASRHRERDVVQCRAAPDALRHAEHLDGGTARAAAGGDAVDRGVGGAHGSLPDYEDRVP